MIDPTYVQTLARYNSWQNKQITKSLEPVPEAVLMVDRRAFFGSIFATLNHLLWGDRMWMHRFDATFPKPEGGADTHTELTPNFAVWKTERARTDTDITVWADSLRAIDLQGELSWYSGLTGTDRTQPLGLCLTHMFNHQTHHRGQVHAMMTAAGLEAPVSDLVFMPEDF